MGAARKGLEAGRRQGKKADSDGNIVSESAKGSGRGALAGAGAGALEDGLKGVKKGVELGTKAGGSIPYAGVVLGPLGGVIGGAVGGGIGVTTGVTKGAVAGAVGGAESSAKEVARNRNKDGLFNNLKKAFFGDNKKIAKHLWVKKAKFALLIALIVFILLSAIWEAVAEEKSDESQDSMSEVYHEENTTDASELYKDTGSLIMANENEDAKPEEQDIFNIREKYLNKISASNPQYKESFMKEYEDEESEKNETPRTVAHNITNVTGIPVNKQELLNPIGLLAKVIDDEKGADEPEPADIGERKQIYEHILRTEKYNYNNILWTSFRKDEDTRMADANAVELKQVYKDNDDEMEFEVDEDTLLWYPKADRGGSIGVKGIINIVRPYLQTWYIPFDLIIGTEDAQIAESDEDAKDHINTDLAYQVIARAYHEIQLDRYLMETKTRENVYRIYDVYQTETTVTRTCTQYRKEIKIDNGKDDIVAVGPDGEKEPAYKYETVCKDGKQIESEKRLVRSNVKERASSTNNIYEKWKYVVSIAKMLDRVLLYEYEFEPYYEHSMKSYYDFMDSSSIDVANYRKNEESLAVGKTTDYEFEFEFETSDEKYEPQGKFTKNMSYTKENDSINKAFWEEVPNTTKITTEKVGTTTYKIGTEYTDKYTWEDTLPLRDSHEGKYNVKSVIQVTGEEDFKDKDKEYYSELESYGDLNLIDIMNSDNTIYEKYISEDEINTETTNIGIRRHFFDLSYSILKRDLNDLKSDFPSSGLMYGQTFEVASSVDLSMIAQAGNENAAMVALAQQFVGKNIDYMLSMNNYRTFFRNHWCAMFVSYCLREVEAQTGTKIPIPNYTGCSSFWVAHSNKVGFYDVGSKNDLKALQPGDIILFSWPGSEFKRDHTALVSSVEKDENGNVTKVITIDGNWGGTGTNSYNNSTVQYVEHTDSGYAPLSTIASFVSISTVLESAAENGGAWVVK